MPHSNENINILEAVLFAAGDAVPIKKLCEVMGWDVKTLENTAMALGDYYDFSMRGIKLVRLGESFQLCSRGEYSQYVRGVLETRKPNALSPSALEVLAIIAYKQPVTRAYIDQIRGVDSSNTVSSLSEKGLIEGCGRLDAPGRPMLYRTTEVFLRAFGISGLNQLPTIESLELGSVEQLAIEQMGIGQMGIGQMGIGQMGIGQTANQ